MAKLFYKDKPIIGLDISAAGLKVMALDAKRMVVEGYGSVDLNPDKLQESLDGDSTYLKENLIKLLTDNVVGALPSNHAVMSIPASRTFSRTVTLPIEAEKDLDDAIRVEVDQYIPIPIESLYVDYEIIERTKKDLTLIMTAAPKKIVDSCVDAAIAAKLRPVLVEPSINAIARVITKTEEGHLTSVIIDIGPTSTDIAVLDNSVVRVTGSVAVGGNTFTRDIADKLSVTLENAHQYKVLNGLSVGPRQAKITQALKPSLRRISTEVNKVMRYYKERLASDQKIEQVLIVGSGSNVPGIGDYYTNDLIMPVRVANPWQQLNFAKLPQPHKQFRPRYITVTGLASVDHTEVWK